MRELDSVTAQHSQTWELPHAMSSSDMWARPNTDVLSQSDMCGIQFYTLWKDSFVGRGMLRACPMTESPNNSCSENSNKENDDRDVRANVALSILSTLNVGICNDRSLWRRVCRRQSLEKSEVSRITAIRLERQQRKTLDVMALSVNMGTTSNLICPTSSKVCRSKAGLMSHLRHKRH